ncbi:DUF6212 domain-containing protein [Pleurocapsa sp. PCC 7319]|uniref:DUF6212 domain-containing protein n=1 Tax=Pleurocapsa sp. PCC 7319 TaxID=118161 RepID=UPI000348C409|nr:DUF6212 domain-containing protein [Pleurocapsa sp. PCC 7319]
MEIIIDSQTIPIRDATFSENQNGLDRLVEIKDESKIQLHPCEETETIAILPYAVPQYTTVIKALVCTENEHASEIEYAMAVIEINSDVEARYAITHTEYALYHSGWHRVDKNEIYEIVLELLDVASQNHHLVIATRLPENSHREYAWARWIDFQFIFSEAAESSSLTATKKLFFSHQENHQNHLDSPQLFKEKKQVDTIISFDRDKCNGVNSYGHSDLSLESISKLEKSLNKSKLNHEVRLIAFYLPQFHPIPENDQWWGNGFTEWINVTKAKPWFQGHYQPHLPADLGFYDLRLAEVREAQAKLAQNYGIYGFCYYYYWFNGKRLLERPLDAILESQKPNFPFCICWANENWTRSWDGKETDILMAQEYTPESLEAFAASVVPYLLDSRYIKVNNKPMLLIYRISHIPNPSEVIVKWRQMFRDRGVGEVHIAGVLGFGLKDPVALGCDSGVQFPPNSLCVKELEPPGLENQDFPGHAYDYEYAVQQSLEESLPDNIFPGVMPSWDNTARRQEKGTIWLNSSPDKYKLWLQGAIKKVNRRQKDEQIVFINAWNEWAEGAHLEPDHFYGHAYLNATREALLKQSDWKSLVNLLKTMVVNDTSLLENLLDELEQAISTEKPSSHDLIHFLKDETIYIEDIAAVQFSDSPESSFKVISHLEFPQAGTCIYSQGALNVKGWVQSFPHQPVAIELIANDTLLKQIPVNLFRQDVAHYHIGYQCKYNGFNSHVVLDRQKLFNLADSVDISLRLVLSNSSTVLLNTIKVKNSNDVLKKCSKTLNISDKAAAIIRQLEKRINSRPSLFILHDIASAGAQLFLVRLLEWIQANQPDLEIEILINIAREQVQDYGIQGKFVLDRLNDCGKTYFIDSGTNLPENIANIQSDKYSCIYVNTSTLGDLLDAVGLIPSPVIVHIHELTFWIKYRLGLDKFNKLLKYNPRFIACSNAVKHNLMETCKVPAEQIEVIHAFVPTDSLIKSKVKTKKEARRELNIDLDTFVIASCGTLDWRKGADLLIPLAVLLKEKLPTQKFVFLWVGDWQNELSKAEMEFVIAKAKLQDHLLLTGYKKDPINYLEAGNIFLLLSREDPFPLVMSEAAICKLPIVGFEGSGGVTEFVESEAGLTVPYLNLNSMADAISYLFDSPKLVEKMGNNAYKKVFELYSEDVLAPKILALINQMSQKNSYTP